VSGAFAGAVVNGILHPLDTVKTVRQVDPKAFKGVFNAGAQLVQTGGIGALYKGFGPAIIGTMPSSALHFGTFEAVKGALLPLIPPQHFRQLSPFVHMFSAACGNICSSVIFVPKEVLKQKLQANQVPGVNLSLAQVLVKTLNEQGVAGLYAGYWSTLLRNIPTTMLNFSVYEQAKLAIIIAESKLSHVPHSENAIASLYDPRRRLKPAQNLAVGCLAGAVSSGLTTPLDVVKTRFATGRAPLHASILTVMSDVLRTDGPQGLFAGLQARVLWQGLFSAIGLSTYEFAKSLFFPPIHSAAPAPPSPSAHPSSSSPPAIKP